MVKLIHIFNGVLKECSHGVCLSVILINSVFKVG